MAYSSKAQEAYFKPYRIQVATAGDRDYASFIGHRVILVDATKVGKESVIDHWLPPGWKQKAGSWHSERDEAGHYRSAFDAKAVAIAKAKQLATEMGLPFDLQRDVVMWRDVIDGPKTACLICGGMDRSHLPYVCQQCQDDAARGAAARAEPGAVPVILDLGRITGLSSFYHDEEVLGLALQQLTGSPIEKPPSSSLPKDKYKMATARWRMQQQAAYTSWEWHSGLRMITLTEAQAAGLMSLVDIFHEVREDAWKKGHSAGEGLLVKLATGEATVEQYQAIKEKAQ